MPFEQEDSNDRSKFVRDVRVQPTYLDEVAEFYPASEEAFGENPCCPID
jgi:hypothetical protein